MAGAEFRIRTKKKIARVDVTKEVERAAKELGAKSGALLVSVPHTTAAVTVYLGLFPSIGAYGCWAYGVSKVGPTRATLFQYLIPVFAAGLAFLLLGEEVRLFHIAGAALIIGGLVLATRQSRR